MLRLTINQKKVLNIEPGSETGTGSIDGTAYTANISGDTKGHLHLILDNKSVNVEVLEIFPREKRVLLKVNNSVHEILVEDRFDLLLKEMGMETGAGKEVKNIKAPMPGLVIEILIKPGEVVEKDSPVIILEAMKMENVIKSPSRGTVKAISAIKGHAVEKNEVLLSFE
jgi:acetyl/propionyl-CoA carboxylase alpha subunit